MFILIPTAVAATITVGTDVSTLQEAVQAASFGDTIILPAGTWPGCVRSTGSIEIRGAGSHRTTIQASGCEDAIVQAGGELSMTGVALSNPTGRALRVENASLILREVHVTSSGAPSLDGGALYLRAVDAMVTDFQAAGCRARAGGAIYASGGSLTLVDMVLSGNQAGHGGAIVLTDRAEANLSIGRFEDNEATSGPGGALHATGGVRLEDSGSSYTGNRAATDGGAVAQDTGGMLKVENLTLSGNQAPGGRGGGLFVDGVGSVTVLATAFADGQAQSGGGMFVSAVAPGVSIRETTFSQNRATGDGGGLAADASGEIRLAAGQLIGNQAARGGGISLQGSPGRLSDGIEIADNRAEHGGGVHAVAEQQLALNLDAATLRANQAGRSGGGFFTSGVSAVRILNSTLDDNTAPASGSVGAIAQAGSVALSDARLCGAAADDGTILSLQDVQSVSILRSALPSENQEEAGIPFDQGLVWSNNRAGCTDAEP